MAKKHIPPKGKPFTKDDPRINREGRPPRRKVSELLGEILASRIDDLPAPVKEKALELTADGKMTVGEAVTMALLVKLFEGNPAAMRDVMDRLEGKAPDVLFHQEGPPPSPEVQRALDAMILRIAEREKLLPAEGIDE